MGNLAQALSKESADLRHVTWQAGSETLLLHLILMYFRHAHFTSACSGILAALETLRIDNVYIWERMSICTC